MSDSYRAKCQKIHRIAFYIQVIISPFIGIAMTMLRNTYYMISAWIYNIGMDMMGMVICGLLYISIVKDRNDTSFSTGCFSSLVSTLDLILLFDLISYCIDGHPEWRICILVLNTFYYLLATVINVIYSRYLIEVAEFKDEHLTTINHMILAVAAIVIVSVIGNIWGQYYFYVDEYGCLTYPGDTYWIYILLTNVIIMISIWMVFSMKVSAAKKRILFTFLCFPLISSFIEGIVDDLSIIYPSLVCAIVFIYGNIFTAREAELMQKKLEVVQKENELLEAREKNARVEAELDMASKIQTHLLPGNSLPFPDHTAFDLYASMKPAREVCGDFYDYYLLDDDHLVLTIADVSGKGVPAALYMMVAKTMLKNAARQGLSPKEVLNIVNNQLNEGDPESAMFVTVWFAIVKLSTMTITASNAGHEYPVIRHKDGTFELFKDKHSLVLGAMSGTRYSEYTINMEEGSTIFVYTDGVTEANNSAQELFSTDRVVSALNSEPDASPSQLIRNMHTAINDFVGPVSQFDDITMLSLKFR